MFAPMHPLATFTGSRYGPDHGYSEAWQPNDGAVDTISQSHDGVAELVQYNGSTRRGRWPHVLELDNVDHVAAVGIKLGRDVFDVYSSHSAILSSLPTAAVISRRLELGLTDYAVPEELVAGVRQAGAHVSAPQDIAELQAYCGASSEVVVKRMCAASKISVPGL